jgi:hypothetical protein
LKVRTASPRSTWPRGGASCRGGFGSGSAITGILLLILLCDLLCFAKPKYDHTAKVTYRAEQKHLKYLLEGRDDLYYDDSYYGDSWVCTPGDEHHAPDCRKSQDWYVYEIDRAASVKLVLDDGRSITFIANHEAGISGTGWLHPNCDPEPCDSKFPKIANIWHLFDDYYLAGEEKDVEFDVSYRLVKTGDIEIKPRPRKL